MVQHATARPRRHPLISSDSVVMKVTVALSNIGLLLGINTVCVDLVSRSRLTNIDVSMSEKVYVGDRAINIIM